MRGLCTVALIQLVVGCNPASPPAAPTNAPVAATSASPAAAPAATPVTFSAAAAPANASGVCAGTLRTLTIGVPVAPPNVVHTPPFVARALGYFAKRCIDANIVQFEGGLPQPPVPAAARGAAMGPRNESAIGAGLKGKQVWGMAPKPPQAYVVAESIKTAADLKGKRLSAA